jgi:hypothetical protein
MSKPEFYAGPGISTEEEGSIIIKLYFQDRYCPPLPPWVPEIARAERLDPIEGRDERYWSWLSPVK